MIQPSSPIVPIGFDRLGTKPFKKCQEALFSVDEMYSVPVYTVGMAMCRV